MKTLSRILIVLLISVIVGLAMLPLAQTGWAETMRISQPEQASVGRPEGAKMRPAGVGLIAGLFRSTLFMLIPGSITLGILNAVRRRRKTPAAKKAMLADQ